MRNFDFNDAVVTLFVAGGAIFITVYICLLAYGFDEREISNIQAALAYAWVPATFVWGGFAKRNDKDSN